MVTSKKALKNTWLQHVQAWKQSKLSQKAYCEQHNLKTHQLSYWYRKFEQGSQQKVSEPQSNFIPVTLSEVKAKTADDLAIGLTLQLPNGICLTDIQLSNVPVAQALIKALL